MVKRSPGRRGSHHFYRGVPPGSVCHFHLLEHCLINSNQKYPQKVSEFSGSNGPITQSLLKKRNNNKVLKRERLTRILSGFKSLWLMGGFKPCRYIKPLAIPLPIVHTWLLGSPWDSGVLWSSTNLYRFLGMYSITRKGVPAFRVSFSCTMSLCKIFIPLNATMLSWRKSLLKYKEKY